jgi:hypothetical protein
VVLFGDCYFARFFRDEASGDVLVTHQSAANGGWGQPRYISPYKLAKVDEYGVLRLHWWPNNEAFKGRRLDARLNVTTGTLDRSRFDRSKGLLVECTVEWDIEGGRDHLSLPQRSPTRTAGKQRGNNTYPGFRITSGAKPPALSDTLLEGRAAPPAPPPLPTNQAIVIDALGRGITGFVSEHGGVDRDWLSTCRDKGCPGFSHDGIIDHALDLNVTRTAARPVRAVLRMLLRNEKLELYANDVLLHVYGGVGADPQLQIGILQPAGVTVSGVAAWEMDLPGDTVSVVPNSQ